MLITFLRLFRFVKDLERDLVARDAELEVVRQVNSALQFNANTLHDAWGDTKSVADSLALRCLGRKIYGENIAPAMTDKAAREGLPASVRDQARAGKAQAAKALRELFAEPSDSENVA